MLLEPLLRPLLELLLSFFPRQYFKYEPFVKKVLRKGKLLFTMIPAKSCLHADVTSWTDRVLQECPDYSTYVL